MATNVVDPLGCLAVFNHEGNILMLDLFPEPSTPSCVVKLSVFSHPRDGVWLNIEHFQKNNYYVWEHFKGRSFNELLQDIRKSCKTF